MSYEKVVVLIPAYKPDFRLPQLVDDLLARGFSKIVVVDDGGGETYRPIFDQLLDKATVLVHEVNRGKGAALKTGLNFRKNQDLVGVVTADADGQHTPDDCARVADALIENPQALVLGARCKKQMPPRSKFGNSLTCLVFFLATRRWVNDTQTGLRGIPAACMEPFAQLEGDRYEYEQNMLMDTCRRRMEIKEVEIETIYIDDNKSSHFNALRDGLRIYGLLFRQAIRYTGSAVLSAGVDYGMFVLLSLLLIHGMPAFPHANKVCIYGARLVSSLVNYFVNRELVFQGDRRKSTIVKYYILAIFVAVATKGVFDGLLALGLTRYLAQPIASGILFCVSYPIQKYFVFKKKENH